VITLPYAALRTGCGRHTGRTLGLCGRGRRAAPKSRLLPYAALPQRRAVPYSARWARNGRPDAAISGSSALLGVHEPSTRRRPVDEQAGVLTGAQGGGERGCMAHHRALEPRGERDPGDPHTCQRGEGRRVGS